MSTARVVLGAVWLAGCAPHEGPRPQPATPEPTPAVAPPIVVPAVEPPASLGPGRYSLDVHKTLKATHAMNFVTEDARASFVLTLDANAQATACRGKRSRSFNDGPTVHTSSDLREQQGYRGRWDLKNGEWLDIELTPDNEVCPQQRLYSNLEPGPWKLRCRKLKPAEHPVAQDGAVLACELMNRPEHKYVESYAHIVPGVMAGEWLLLGDRDGLLIRWEDDSVEPGANPSTVTVTRATARVEDDTWSRP